MKNNITNVGVNIVVNGKPVKQYSKDGEIFIEAKSSTEYEIHIHNNNSTKIEAVIGVDGIDVITGNPNTEKSNGYVIDAYDTLKLKGYRISDEKVAAFKFCKKENSYASAKTVYAQNGVITVKCYAEEILPCFYNSAPQIIRKTKKVFYEYEEPYWPNNPIRYGDITCGTAYAPNNITCSYTSNIKSNLNGITQDGSFTNFVNTNQLLNETKKCSEPEVPSAHFDMGSSFGSAKDSSVKGVSFVRGYNLGEINIYYSSRNSLKEMGINVTNEQKVVLPQGTSKYCQPPKDWCDRNNYPRG